MNANFALVLCLCVATNVVVSEPTPEPKDFISVLMDTFEDFRRAVEQFVDKRLDPLSRFRMFTVQTLKSYTIVEPTAKETDEADKAMSISFGVSSGLLPDTNDSLNVFCEERRERREIVDNFVTRKFTFNLICRLTFALISSQMRKTNDQFCEGRREEFLRNARAIRDYDRELAKVRHRFRMSLIDIQTTNLGFSRTRALCCSFWTFRRDFLSAIGDESTQRFFRQLFEDYFHLMTRYLCFFHTVISCPSSSSHTGAVNVTDNEYSLAMNWIRSVAKVSSLLL